jgi:CubicO group peptidase (beta-lactamase class C family)
MHWEHFQRRVAHLTEAFAVPGLAYCVEARGEQYCGAVGFRDVAAEKPFVVETLVPIASLTKTMTALVLLELEAAGKLSLDDPLLSHLPVQSVQFIEAVGREPNHVTFGARFRRATIREVLSHTANSPNGDVFSYSSSIFSVLADVAASVAGRSFEAIIGEVLERFGMTASFTSYDDSRFVALQPELARPYVTEPSEGWVQSEHKRRALDASRGVISTVIDLMSYLRGFGHAGDSLAELRRQAWSVRMLPNGSPAPYGLGWFVRQQDKRGPAAYWHYGQFDRCYAALMVTMPALDLHFVMLSNCDTLSRAARLIDGDLLRSAFAILTLECFADAGSSP